MLDDVRYVAYKLGGGDFRNGSTEGLFWDGVRLASRVHLSCRI